VEVAQVEQTYASRFSAVHASSGGARYDAVMAMQQQVHTFPAFPTSYPTSALLGCVTITDCLTNEEYVTRFPDAEENESAYVFIATRPRTLRVPQRISGQHKIWQLDAKLALAAVQALRPVSSTWDAKPTAPTGPSQASLVAPSPVARGGPPGLRATAAPFMPPGLSTTSATAAARAAAAKATDAPITAPTRLDLYGGAVMGDAPHATRAPAPISLQADRRQRLQVLQDGLVLLRGALSLDVQQAIIDEIRELGLGPSGFYTPETRGGSMHLQMMCLGMHWDPLTNQYSTVRSNADGQPVPPLPPALWELVCAAAATASEACPSIPDVMPGVCLANFYTHGGRLGMHQDKSESADSLRRGVPVVSVSLGDACEFGYAAVRPEDTDASQTALGGAAKARTVRLESGDILIFGGPARMLFHSVQKIFPNHRPKGLVLAPGRLNLTFREL
jgi:alkylated DNA repair dioxygenase AlkB